VRDARGRPGVWFYSLDCSQPLAVWAARIGFGLRYFHARMRETVGEFISYDCRRRGSAETAHYEYRGIGGAARVGAGTFEQFLVERYRLFAVRRGRLVTGEVWHEPYPLQAAEALRWSDAPLRWAGFDATARPPLHAAYSPGVDVRVFGIERS
jgi:uncharacterized protein YqjF (DUF2071 family)